MLFCSRVLDIFLGSPLDARNLVELTFLQVALESKGHSEDLKLRGVNRIDLAAELVENFENFLRRICAQTHLSL